MRIIVSLFLLFCLEASAQRGGNLPRGRSNGAPGADLDMLNALVATFDGTLRAIDNKHVLIEMGEEQSLSIEVNKKTQYFRGTKVISSRDLVAGAIVTVEAKKVANQLVAVAVKVKDAK
jgi:hypothetical protein